MAVSFDKTDLQFVLAQILQAEAGQPPVNPHLPFGLREVAGTSNSVEPGQDNYGSADQVFPRVGDPVFQTVTVNIDGTIFDPHPGVDGDTMTTSYASTSANGLVVDTGPRIISNLIADQTANNPAAVAAQAAALEALGAGYQNLVPNPDFDPDLPVDPVTNPEFVLNNDATPPVVDASGNLFIPNITPDAGLSAPFNSLFTFFAQFFDHGLDLVNKGGSGTVFMPLAPDDPLILVGPDGVAGTGDELTMPQMQFMVLTRATNLPGPDGVVGTADDIHEQTNQTTPFVDQNQTYTSHPSHQVFLRDYVVGVDGKLHTTGRLLSGGDGGMSTWADVKANALKLGIHLTDADVGNVPLLATDEYGNFIAGPNGFAQVVVRVSAGADGIAGTGDDINTLVEGTAEGLDLSDVAALGGTVVRIGHAFLADIAHNAAPVFDAGGNLVADADAVAGNAVAFNPLTGNNLEYDNELLDAHYIAGDGRVNENIGLTAIHTIFHSEHNRLLEQIKGLVRAELANGDTAFASSWVLPGANLIDGIQDNEWNGERLFQAAKFGTEVQYQHLVFEEFARKIAPNIHAFGNVDISLDAAIVAEFAHAVYRFGHSILDESINRFVLDEDGTPVIDPATGRPVLNEIGMIEAFTNPLAFAAAGEGAAAELISGSAHQVANEIDEFVTGSVRNNLLGLPLDLAAINIARGRDTGVPPLNLLRAQLYQATGDEQLKPYENWSEFGQFLKHPASLINFVAAYATHASILSATSLEDKRAAALDLVLAGLDTANMGTDAWDFMHSLGAYANDLDNPLAVHATWSTGSITGLDNIDLWIGGLAEKQTLFGGLLGSTFNFIFETQLEALQDGDRLYYLPRLEGTHLLSEIEGISLAELIRVNTGAAHLPGDVFLTPEYTIEAKTITADPATWLRNPITGALLVERLADGTIHFIGDDNLLGNTIVLGGTEGDDRLQAGHADDDTVWGDGGDDWIDGGNGNDFLYGGDGDDFITDSGGDDIIHGDAGNDTIYAGSGDDIVFGGDGDDFIDLGFSGPAGAESADGGLGNDIIIAHDGESTLLGNEGDDWLVGGEGFQLLVGDQGAPTGMLPLVAGNDVLIGGAGGDRMQGFSGDDIMLGEGGFDRFEGGLGFDWASYEFVTAGVSLDMRLKEFTPDQLAPFGDAVRDRFVETEAVSGSRYDDVIRGTDIEIATDPLFNELTNVNLIRGLADFFPEGPVAFSDGNIILGGDGSDFLQGGGGNDIIDGDAFLHVELTRNANGEIYAGSQIIREILYADGSDDIDTAVFADISANYQWTSFPDEQGFYTITHVPIAGGGIVDEGTDRLRNIERLQFADITIAINPFDPAANNVPSGTVLIQGDADGDPTNGVDPVVGSVLTADITTDQLVDFDFANGEITSHISYQWQYEEPLGPGGGGPRWVNIVGATEATYTPASFFRGMPLRLQVSFVDPTGAREYVYSAPTNNVALPPGVNTAPFVVPQQGLVGLPDTSTQVGVTLNLFLPITVTFGDNETAPSALTYSATLVNGQPLSSVGLAFVLVTDVTGVIGARITGTPTVAGPIEVRVIASDNGPGFPLAATDSFIINVLPPSSTPFVVTSLPDVVFNAGQPVDLVIPRGTFSDAQTGVESLTLSASLGTGQSLLSSGLTASVLPNGDLRITGTVSLNFVDINGPFSIRVIATDPGGLTVSDTFAVDMNYAPTGVTLDGVEEDGAYLVEADEAGAVVGTVTVIDRDPGDTFTFLITNSGGSVDDRFEIVGGVLKLKDDVTLDDEAGAFTVNISVFDSGGLPAGSNPYSFTITVDANHAPEGTPMAVLPDAIEDQLITILAADLLDGFTDPDGDELSIADVSIDHGIIIDNLDGTFTIDPEENYSGLLTLAYNVIDGNDGVTPASVFINVQAVNDAPQFDIDIFSFVTDLDVGLLLAIDPDLGDTHTFRLTSNLATDNLLLEIDPVTNMLRMLDPIGVDFDADGEYVVEIEVTDSGGLSFTAMFGIAGMPNTPEPTNGTDVAETLPGTDASDMLFGFAGNDTLIGGLGHDRLDGGLGADTMIGGPGNDIYIVDNAKDKLTELANEGLDTVRTALASYKMANEIEYLIYTGVGNFKAIGNNSDNVIIGGIGNDNLSGGNGHDTLWGGDGNDTLNGGNDDDYLDGGAGNDKMVGGNGNNVMIGGDGDDTITGGTGNDTITGGDGNDTIKAGAGNNVVEGGAGDDKITTAAGDDTITGGDGNDTINAGAGTNVVDGGAGDDKITTTGGHDTVMGGDGNDTINAGAGNDVIDGGDGNDTIIGGAGDDIIIGGAGNDTLRGDKGIDTFVFHAGFGHDIVTFGDKGVDQDLIQFDISMFADFEAVLAASVQVGKDVVITHTPDDTITLKAFAIANLGADDFLFV